MTLGLIALGIILIVVLIQVSGGKKKPVAATTTTKPTSLATTTTTTPTTGSTFPTPSTLPLTAAAVVPTCAPSAGTTKRIVWFTKGPPNCIAKTSVWDATFDTSVGTYVVQMNAASSFAAVNNFVFLTQWNYYNGTFFHRVVPGFVIQGGDPAGTGSGGPHGYPGYSFTGNFPPESCTTTPAQAACYQPGDFVMANSNGNAKVQNASTDASQFFVVLPGGQTTLNGEPTYTLFGKVTSGMSVVEKIGSYGVAGSQTGAPSVKVYLLKVTLKQVKA